MSWSGRWWTFYKWLGRGIEGQNIAGPWYPTRMMDHYQESSVAYCSCRLYYLTNSCHTHLRVFVYFYKYSALEHMCSKTSGEAPPSRIHRPTLPLTHSYAIYSNLDANTYNPKSQSSRGGKRGGRSMNYTRSLPPCSPPQKEKQNRKSG